MKVENMEIDNIEEWLRWNWEKVASLVMFAVAVGALFFAMCERNKWKASESPVPPARHGADGKFKPSPNLNYCGYIGTLGGPYNRGNGRFWSLLPLGAMNGAIICPGAPCFAR